MNKKIRKAVKWLSLSVLAVVVSIMLALTWVVFHPDLLLSPTTLQWAARLAKNAGVTLYWSQVEADAESLSLFRKKFALRFNDLCTGSPGESFQVCFARARFEFTVDFSGGIPAITNLGPVRLTGGDGVVNASGEGDETAEEREQPQPGAQENKGLIAGIVPELLQKAALGRIWIEFDSLQVLLSKEESFEGAVRLSKRSTESLAGSMNWDLRVFGLTSPYLNEATARLRISNPSGGWKGNWQFSGDLEGLIPGGGYARSDVRAQEKGSGRFAYEFDGTYDEQGKLISARGRGDIGPNEIAVHMLSAELENWITGIKTVSLKRCSFRSIPGSLTADCPLTLGLRSAPRLGGLPELALPVSPSMRIQADLKTAFPPDPGNAAEGSLNIDLEPASTKFLSGGATIRARIAGVPTEFPRDWRLDTEVESELRLHDFRRLVRALSSTDWAVPAPFNALDGNIRLAISGNASLQEGRVPLNFETQLDSRGQRLDLDASGAFSFDALALQSGSKKGLSPRLDLKILLSDVRLVLPRLQLRAPPRILPDSRIHRQREEAGASAFKYRIQLETPEGSPVRLVSNLSKRPVPVHLRLALSDSEPMSGTVRIADFPLKLFRRDASVQHITFTFSPEREKTRLDGVLRVSYTDYRVKVLLLGSLEEPSIQLTSDPPLPERQLLSVLLFGRPLEELDPMQSESVGSARAALADSALNLASLYLLAATPIESFGYDPSSGLFSAKVRLGEGTSLNLGAEAGELSQIGIRRRLSRFWTITTTVGAAQEHDSSVMAFLEWVNRY